MFYQLNVVYTGKGATVNTCTVYTVTAGEDSLTTIVKIERATVYPENIGGQKLAI